MGGDPLNTLEFEVLGLAGKVGHAKECQVNYRAGTVADFLTMEFGT